MVQSAATSVAEYLAELPPDRRGALTTLHDSIRRALPAGFEEVLQYGMISYVVPLARFPKTYNGQPLAVLAIASQKQHMALYLQGLYGRDELRTWFERAYANSGKKLDMGKACLRFKHLDDLAMEVVIEALGKVGVDDLIAIHDAAHPPKSAARAAPRPSAARKAKR